MTSQERHADDYSMQLSGSAVADPGRSSRRCRQVGIAYAKNTPMHHLALTNT